MALSLRSTANINTANPNTSGNPTVPNSSTGNKQGSEAALILLLENTRTRPRNRKPTLLEIMEYFNNTLR